MDEESGLGKRRGQWKKGRDGSCTFSSPDSDTLTSSEPLSTAYQLVPISPCLYTVGEGLLEGGGWGLGAGGWGLGARGWGLP